MADRYLVEAFRHNRCQAAGGVDTHDAALLLAEHVATLDRSYTRIEILEALGDNHYQVVSVINPRG